MMRGGFLHSTAIARPLRAAFRALGAVVVFEYFVAVGGVRGAIDLWVAWGDLRVACEIENSADRVEGDLAKAAAAGADLLLIVVPTPGVARAVKRSVARANRPDSLRIQVATFGQAMQRLTDAARFSDFLE